MNKNNYYKNAIQEIQDLKDIDPMKAYKKLEEELNMPYIPENYEIKFNKLLQDVRAELLQNVNINNELSKDSVVNILLNNDEYKIPMALGKLAHLHINSMLDDLDKVFANTEIANIIKTVIYEYCVEQEVDHEFKWNGLLVNPIIVGSVVNLKSYQDAFEYIDNNIKQNPSLKDVAIKHLELYSLKYFPKFIDETKGVGPCIVQISYEAMGIPYIGDNNKEQINKIKKIIAK